MPLMVPQALRLTPPAPRCLLLRNDLLGPAGHGPLAAGERGPVVAPRRERLDDDGAVGADADLVRDVGGDRPHAAGPELALLLADPERQRPVLALDAAAEDALPDLERSARRNLGEDGHGPILADRAGRRAGRAAPAERPRPEGRRARGDSPPAMSETDDPALPETAMSRGQAPGHAGKRPVRGTVPRPWPKQPA